MKEYPENVIFEKAYNWIENNQKVVLATVIQTWGSSPLEVGSRMIINEKGNFFRIGLWRLC